MYPHRIRLRGPWECEPLRCDDAHPPPIRRVTMPCRWAELGLADFAGRVRFRRRFGYPGNIDADERVWLTCADMDVAADVRLNGVPLAVQQNATFEFEVTSLLQARNELVMEVEGPSANGGLWGEVALEVRCTAFLRRVTIVRAADAFVVSGEVVGISERPLELYVLLDHRQAGYDHVVPEPAGRSFRLAVARPEGVECPSVVQVDLVNGATVWYRMTWPIGDAATSGANE